VPSNFFNSQEELEKLFEAKKTTDPFKIMKRLVVGISGASGVIYGIRMLEVLRGKIETHLVMTEQAKQTLSLETDLTVGAVESLASFVHSDNDLSSPLASGSFITQGMIIVPCSIKTLSAVANSYGQALIARAADVNLKERRCVVLVVRETPLHLGHIRLMAKVTEMGGVVLPPVPAFYHKPASITDIVDYTIGKILDLFEIPHLLFHRWRE
jgi:4-hydroxy-3-polyprenylbenzoate decarboxylase